MERSTISPPPLFCGSANRRFADLQKQGFRSPDASRDCLKRGGKGYIDFGFAKYDHTRDERQGFPEAIYAPSKTTEQLLVLARKFLKTKNLSAPVIFTRLEDDRAKAILELSQKRILHNPVGKILAIIPPSFPLKLSLGVLLPRATQRGEGIGKIVVITAGTGDISVAEEAAFTSQILGSSVKRLYDVGVAGIHRLLENNHNLLKIQCAIVCAGMEGALPSVVGGLASCPVIGVPTSVGYGVAQGGRAALDAMLSSCASNVCVVNIDNGFSAGVIAHLIAKNGSMKNLGLGKE